MIIFHSSCFYLWLQFVSQCGIFIILKGSEDMSEYYASIFYKIVLCAHLATRGNERKILSKDLEDKERKILVRKGWKIVPQYKRIKR